MRDKCVLSSSENHTRAKNLTTTSLSKALLHILQMQKPASHIVAKIIRKYRSILNKIGHAWYGTFEKSSIVFSTKYVTYFTHCCFQWTIFSSVNHTRCKIRHWFDCVAGDSHTSKFLLEINALIFRCFYTEYIRIETRQKIWSSLTLRTLFERSTMF